MAQNNSNNIGKRFQEKAEEEEEQEQEEEED